MHKKKESPCRDSISFAVMHAAESGDRDAIVEIHVLNEVEQLDAFGHWALERLSAANQAHAAGALIDDGRARGFREVVVTTGAAGVDQRRAAQVAICDLVARHLDGVILGGQVGVDAFVGLAELQGVVAAIGFGEFLFDDVGFDGDAQVIRLARQVGGDMIIRLFGLEGFVAQIAPEHRHEPELVGLDLVPRHAGHHGHGRSIRWWRDDNAGCGKGGYKRNEVSSSLADL